MRHIRSKMFCLSMVGVMLCGTTVVSASPTAGFSSYMSYISTVSETSAAGVSNILTTSMVASAKTEMLAGVTINVENLEHRAVASNGEPELEDNSVSDTTLGAAIDDANTYLAVCQTGGYINVRESATTESSVVGKLRNNNVATVVAVEGEWYKITSGNVTGYVRSDLVSVGNDALISSLNGTYTYAESKAEEDARLKEEAAKAREQAAANAWAYEQYVVTYYGSNAAGVSGQAIVDFATQFVGYPYVWGGNSLTQGTDCSGFTKLVYAQFGYNLPRCDSSYFYTGRAVSYAEAQPGDIICYYGHVAIYMGNGMIVHAANSRSGIIISSAAGFGTIVSVRRILN